MPPLSGRGQVGEHVSEQVLGHDHVVGGGPLDEQHRHRVDELVLQRHARMALGDLARDASPELRGGEHVGLVDARDTAAAAPGEHAGTLHDAADLERAVVAGVVGGLVAEPAIAEVDARRSARARSRCRGRRRDPRAAGSSCGACSGAPAAGWRSSRAPSAARAVPARAESAAPFQLGPPTAPSSTASAPRQASRVASGNGWPVASMAAPPNGRSSSSTPNSKRDAATSSTRSCSSCDLRTDAVTGEDADPHTRPSGPMWLERQAHDPTAAGRTLAADNPLGRGAHVHVAKHTGTLRLALRFRRTSEARARYDRRVMPCESLRTLLAGLLLPG